MSAANGPSLTQGQQIDLAIEKPAAGGWMIARHHGQVVLVRGAIPGERVRAVVERAEKRVAYADTRDVLEASADRRPAARDLLCGGALYSHIAYPRQLSIKAEVIRDAFAHVGRHALDGPIDVAASPETGYRMRARFHVHGPRVGFYREGTHQLCDAAATAQMRPEAVTAAATIATTLDRLQSASVVSIAISENILGTERAAYVEVARPLVDPAALERVVQDAGVTGLAVRDLETGRVTSAGDAAVTDPLSGIAGDATVTGVIRRRAESFFQGNRYVLSGLVTAVMSATPDSGEVVDLYAGVGLFSIALAARGHLEITAVEGDHASGEDLRANARPFGPAVRARVMRVEDYLAEPHGVPAAMIVDPPRTGLSKLALQGIVRHAPRRLIYVSCDPPTLARDARGLIDAGYRLESLRAFDFFPITPHIETLAVFGREGSGTLPT